MIEQLYTAGVGKYYVGPVGAVGLSKILSGIWRGHANNASTACKCPQVFSSFRKLKSNIIDWP